MSTLSLEQLRKQAKERLKAHRTAQPTSTTQLAEIQHTLAGELGFANWAALVRHVQANPPGLARYEAIAAAIAGAYATGDFEAIRVVNGTHGTTFAWERDCDRMQRRLPTWYAAATRTETLAHDDARLLVARQSGFESWPALRQSLTPTRRQPTVSAPLPFAHFDPEQNRVRVHGILAEMHWEQVIGLLHETGATALAAGGITDDALARVATVAHLRHLNLDGAGQLTDTGVQHVARLPQLESLDLSSPRSLLTDSGMVVLQALPALRHFKMCWAPLVTDRGLAHLAACPQLEQVNLMGTHTGDGVLTALADKATLCELTTGRLVSDNGLPLLHALPALTRLLLDGPFTDGGLRALAGLDRLDDLGFFWHTPALTSAGLAALALLPNLTRLACEGALCDDRAMGHIAAIPRLQRLHAQGTVASDDGFVALSRSQSLEQLWGRECPNLTGRGFAALAKLPRLAELGVSCARVDDTALAALPHFPALKTLTAMDISDAGFRYVGRCVRLERLLCMYCRDTTDDATRHLTGLPQLKSYYAGMTRITDTSLEILARLPTLEALEFWQVAGITETGVAQLARLPRLKTLEIDGSPQVTRSVAQWFPATVRVQITG